MSLVAAHPAEQCDRRLPGRSLRAQQRGDAAVGWGRDVRPDQAGHGHPYKQPSVIAVPNKKHLPECGSEVVHGAPAIGIDVGESRCIESIAKLQGRLPHSYRARTCYVARLLMWQSHDRLRASRNSSCDPLSEYAAVSELRGHMHDCNAHNGEAFAV